MIGEKLSCPSGKIPFFAKARIVSFGQCWRTHAGDIRFRSQKPEIKDQKSEVKLVYKFLLNGHVVFSNIPDDDSCA